MPRHWTRLIQVAGREADRAGAAAACEHALMKDLKAVWKTLPGIERLLEEWRNSRQQHAFLHEDLVAQLPKGNPLAARLAEHLDMERAEGGSRFEGYFPRAVTGWLREHLAACVREILAHVHRKQPTYHREMARKLGAAAKGAVDASVAFVVSGAAPKRARAELDLNMNLLGEL